MNPKHLATQARIAVETVEVIDDQVKQGQPADKLLAEFYRANRQFGSRDRRFFSNLVFAWFRWRGWIMHGAPGDWEKRTVAAGLLDADEFHPTLELIANELETPLNGPSPSGSASLTEKALLVQKWLGLETTPEVSDLFPGWIKGALVDDGQLAFLQQRPEAWIRVQQSSIAKVKAICEAEDIGYHGHDCIPTALAIATKRGLTELSNKAGHLFEPQNIASQAVGWVCDPKPGQHWWDACAGSGGKSLQLADMMQDDCTIIATDSRSSIMNELSRRIKKKKKLSINMRMLNVIAEDPPGFEFDGILVDAPCSGMGMWARHADARWRMNAAKIDKLAGIQEALLNRVSAKVKPGGHLIYAVCTLTKAETSDRVEQFLAQHNEFQLEPCSHPLTGDATNGVVWINPETAGGDAMFVAKMKKNG